MRDGGAQPGADWLADARLIREARRYIIKYASEATEKLE
jgi:hypothetical protein